LKKFPPNKNEDVQIISYGKHLSLIRAIGAIASQLDKILIFHYLGAVEVAIYFFAIAPIQQINGLFKNIPTLALPKLSQRSFKEIDSVLYKRMVQLFFWGLIMAGIYILIAPYFFKIFFPKYLDSVFFSQLFAAAIALGLPNNFLGPVIQSKLTDIPKSWLYWGIFPQIILIVSLFVLIMNYQILGVIISKFIFIISVLILNLLRWKLLMIRNKIV
jgi:O-antigen/teichoic acid export membrane protein